MILGTTPRRHHLARIHGRAAQRPSLYSSQKRDAAWSRDKGQVFQRQNDECRSRILPHSAEALFTFDAKAGHVSGMLDPSPVDERVVFGDGSVPVAGAHELPPSRIRIAGSDHNESVLFRAASKSTQSTKKRQRIFHMLNHVEGGDHVKLPIQFTELGKIGGGDAEPPLAGKVGHHRIELDTEMFPSAVSNVFQKLFVPASHVEDFPAVATAVKDILG